MIINWASSLFRNRILGALGLGFTQAYVLTWIGDETVTIPAFKEIVLARRSIAFNKGYGRW